MNKASAGAKRSLRYFLYQAVYAATCHSPVLNSVGRMLWRCGKRNISVIAIARSLATTTNAVLKTGVR